MNNTGNSNSENRTRVLFLTNIPSPYRVDFFNEMGKKCELTVLFENNESSERDVSWSYYNFETFQGIIMRGKRINTDTAFCPDVISFLKKHYDYIIVTNIHSPTGILAVIYMKLNKLKYWVEGDGGFVSKGNWIKNMVKRFIISGAAGCFSTGITHDDYYYAYGAKKENVYRYPFTSLRENDLTQADELSVQDVLLLESTNDIKNDVLPKRKLIRLLARLALDLPQDKTIVLYVGQMIYRKGIDLLLECAVEISNERDDFLFVFVGGDCPQAYNSALSQHPNNIRFIPFATKDKLMYYYRASDLFCLPTREDIWGLVINEAMANSLPIVTTQLCGAGLELVHNNINGYIIPTNDSLSLRDSIYKMIPFLMKMGLESRRLISNYTIEEMSSRHMQVLESKNEIRN